MKGHIIIKDAIFDLKKNPKRVEELCELIWNEAIKETLSCVPEEHKETIANIERLKLPV